MQAQAFVEGRAERATGRPYIDCEHGHERCEDDCGLLPSLHSRCAGREEAAEGVVAAAERDRHRPGDALQSTQSTHTVVRL